MQETKQLNVPVPAALLESIKAHSGGLKLYAIVEQALELWLKEHGWPKYEKTPQKSNGNR